MLDRTKELSENDLKQIERFHSGFPWMNISAPATPDNGGIKVLDEVTVGNLIEKFNCAVLSGKLRFAKFVPASGAASRMFKDLFNRNVTIINKFVLNIEKFAFYDKSVYSVLKDGQIVDATLGESGLNYGVKPKGVLKFHRYGNETRTAVMEHMVEAAEYMKNADGTAHLVITISPEHSGLFEEEIERAKKICEARYGIKYDIKTVYQYKWTDTIAVTPENEPFVTEEGEVLHRPGGHGALIHNLKDVDADVVSIKNIDNVAVDTYLPVTVKWKKVLMGAAISLRERIFRYIQDLDTSPSESKMDEIEDFFRTELCIDLPVCDAANRAERLLALLNRPIRVCGMVRNQGEPGGGPFIIREADGSTSLQILEGAQINPDDPQAVASLAQATHFNPVDIVCVLKDYKGNNFDLTSFVDEDAGFISCKSYQGRELKALELPGLWNGSMSRWNTMFVEVPLETFNPVKTVMDLLRPAHQG